VLSGEEIAAIWKACRDDDYGRIVRLLILTACRRQAIGAMVWSEIDEGQITIPPERTKTGRKTGKVHVIPLLPMIAEIVKDVPQRVGRDQVFGVRSYGFTMWHDHFGGLCERSGVKDFVIHDIRRSVATIMGEELSIQPHVIELVLGHQPFTKVQGTYNRARYEREVRAALALWHDYLRTLITGGERKVVPYPQLLG
jgi:integrase